MTSLSFGEVDSGILLSIGSWFNLQIRNNLLPDLFTHLIEDAPIPTICFLIGPVAWNQAQIQEILDVGSLFPKAAGKIFVGGLIGFYSIFN